MTIDEEPGRLSLPSVLVLGGGRWARVMVEVLLTLVSEETTIQMASPAGAPDLERWLDSTGRAGRVGLVERDHADLRPGSAVIVANAARSHVESALWALTRGLPALVEKPLALTSSDVRRLHDAGTERGTLIAPALVFRFARHLDRFNAALTGPGAVDRVELIWTDPAAERRDGEVKRYDAGISVLEDCLPHVFSVFDRAFGASPLFENLAIERGGAKVRLKLSEGAQAFDVVLERNGVARQRVLRAFGQSGTVELDFSVEPGSLRIDGLAQVATEHTAGKGALAAMIRAFLVAAAGGPVDPRLSLGTALHASEITDVAMTRYRESLASSLDAGQLAGSDLDYVVTELLQRSGRLDGGQLAVAGAELRRKLAAGVSPSGWAGVEAAIRAARDLIVTSRSAQ